MNPQALCFLVALSLAALAAVWRGLAQDEPIALDAPTTDSAAVVPLIATTPIIPPFAHFDVNNLNPFVPFAVREAERQRIENPTPPAPPPEIIQRPPEPELPPEPLRLPVLSRAKDPVPECVGLIAHASGRRALLVRMRPGEPPGSLTVGEDVDGWRLDAIDGTTARWTSPAGDQRAFVIAPTSRNVASDGGGGSIEIEEPGSAPPSEETGADPGVTSDGEAPEPTMGR